MNPFVKTYMDQIHGLVNELTDILENYDAQLSQAHEAREKSLQQYWSAGRQISVLQGTLERMPALDAENKALHKQVNEAVERAARILDYAKALAGAIQQ